MATTKPTAGTGENRGRLIVIVAIGLVVLLVAVLAITQILKPAATASPSPTASNTQPSSTPSETPSTQEQTPAPGTAAWDGKGTRKLNDVANPKAVFVEFLDFECEACAGVLPAIQELKKTYGDRVSFETRYFPLPGHFNSMRAARAAEAAAQQGKYYEMLLKLYEKQTEWGEKKTPEDDRFRTYAKDLGLDMTKWEEAYNSAETQKFIEADVELGKSIGVQGTPSFFINGKALKPESMQDLVDAIEQGMK